MLPVLVLYAPAMQAAPWQAAPTYRVIVQFADPQTAGSEVLGGITLAALSEEAQTPLTHLRRAGGARQILAVGRPVDYEQARQIAGRLAALDSVTHAEADRRYFPQLTPDDSQFSRQWYLQDTAGGIDATGAWDISTGSPTTVIAVLDSGTTPHSDLDGRLLAGYDFISDIATANDGDGRDNDPHDPGDFITPAESTDADGPFFGCPATDSSWHGTKVTGVFGAISNNQRGIAAVDFRAGVLPVRVLGKCGGFGSDVADAIRWAAGISDPALPAPPPEPAHIINLSLSAFGPCSSAEQSAIDEATDAGVLVVVAAGNAGADARDYAPANCDNVLAVAASTREGGETLYTNFGAPVSLSAPGGNSRDDDGLYVTSNSGLTAPAGEAYGTVAGTSFSAPLVSGAAALLRAVRPELSPTDLRFLLETSARPFPAGTGDGFGDCTTSRCGAGLLDAGAALAAAANSALGGQGNGTVRMARDSRCVTEQDGELTLDVVREDGTGTVSARVRTRRISAVGGSDFTDIDELLMWADGEHGGKTVTVSIASDSIVEGSEYFTVQIVNHSAGVHVGEPGATVVTIISTNGNTPKVCPPRATASDGGDSSDGGNGGGGTAGWPLLICLLLARRLYIAPL